jgi:hypothetical protein
MKSAGGVVQCGQGCAADSGRSAARAGVSTKTLDGPRVAIEMRERGLT